ncbi:hypothetical protein ACWEQV_16420 [Rhodococcus aetherivorans]|uniref:Sensory transduction regulator n=1 Tax=Rhodococcus aetherivorans TaxID=191292 RepID=A0AA46SG02_9NOCA|nr:MULTISPECIES: hypothetical protein [Rhodococcus]ETT24513.1 hypothetical protein RR21198_0267 [Rhodococcus rhodochrous ATCC 21198]NGP28154.1 hypothetical protein [Rhodococcus aetherivorans]PND48932.1 hypothetical protein CQZ88_27555 [Rhodococcus sp. ENV425]QIX50987.1 hypothetical protein HFP48_16530 [Rhodococcus sp. DMU1]QPG46535.1 hypothetical protein ISO16_05730 [Rhodococcus sp. M8]
MTGAGTGPEERRPAPGGVDPSGLGLRDRVAAALAEFVAMHEPRTNGDDALGFDYAGVPCAVRVVTLTEGLDVVSLTGVLAWDLPLDDALRTRVAGAADALQFGSIHLVERDAEADVVLRYSFPATGLRDSPLTTMLLLVLGGAGDARSAVTGTGGSE